MTAPDTETIAVQIRPGDPMTGQVTGPDGTTEHFAGWLGLARAIERALRSIPTPTAPEGDHA